MAKTPTEIRSLARGHTEAAINTLVGVMNSVEAHPAARVSAATAILDRGWGKPTQPISGDEDGPAINIITKIERVIVDAPKQAGADG
jgi:hypothetical protein